MTWSDLVADVRAQIDVPESEALAWLVDRARVLNAEAAWLLREATIPVTVSSGEWPLPDDCLRTEAVVVGAIPFQRATLSQLDQARAFHNTRPIYADGVDDTGSNLIQIHPPVNGNLTLRYIATIPEPADPATESPPFPEDITPILADGAIGQGLARMDERFDSAGYFDARFVDGIARLKRRRHGHVGRGGTSIRVVR
jgi:hypothetical protein